MNAVVAEAVQAAVKRSWSSNQIAIFDWFKANTGHVFPARVRGLIVRAVAGSGKTTTIVEAARYIPAADKAVFLAFNKSIKEELATRLPAHVWSKTLNGLGYGALRYAFKGVQVDDRKTSALVEAWAVAAGTVQVPALDRETQRLVCALVGKAKNHALVPAAGNYKGFAATAERWQELADRYDIDLGDNAVQLLECADWVLCAGLADTTKCDFDDMMYMVVALNLRPLRYDWLIVDEAQDVSHVQRMMLQMFLKADGRIVLVGDSRQSIYGFRGADSDSMANLAKVFNCAELPLSTTYRCARAIVEYAQEIVADIHAAPDAPAGVVADLKDLDVGTLTAADMLLCRYTAPVIQVAYTLIGRKIACRVQGRDIGAGLVSLIKRIAGKAHPRMNLEKFEPKLSAWKDRELVKAQDKDDEAKMDAIMDKYNSIVAVRDNTPVKTVAGVISEIERMFDGTTGVLLSTVHRAKGLEADRVFVLDPACMPAKRAKQAWQLEQEYNLMYVAYTRARTELYFIDSKQVA